MPAISIVIPTRNRREILLRTLNSLSRQTAPAGAFEVVVVADGCEDDTVGSVRALEPPYPLRILEQAHSGAAAARNRGADAAGAPLLLFLDDDMVASPGLVAAHVEAHVGLRDTAVMGYFTPAERGVTEDAFAAHVHLWWSQRFSEMARRHHRFRFLDLFTGNVSLPRGLFLAAGGFDARFHDMAGEDYEFAVRLLKLRARFRFVKGAASVHNDVPTIERLARRAYAEGRGHVLIARKHPETFIALPLSAPVLAPDPKFLVLLRKKIRAASLFGPVLDLAFRTARSTKLRRPMRTIAGLIRTNSYWNGVLLELGSYAEYLRFVEEMPLRPESPSEIDLDLREDLVRLEEILSRNPADAARMFWGERPLGYVPPEPAAEPLRPIHVLHVLVDWYGEDLLSAALGEAGEWPSDIHRLPFTSRETIRGRDPSHPD